MQIVHEAMSETQETHPLESRKRKIGVEVVRSVNLTSRFFRGPRPRHQFPVWDENEVWAGRVAGAKR
jgi:hypothetical protein